MLIWPLLLSIYIKFELPIIGKQLSSKNVGRGAAIVFRGFVIREMFLLNH